MSIAALLGPLSAPAPGQADVLGAWVGAFPSQLLIPADLSSLTGVEKALLALTAVAVSVAMFFVGTWWIRWVHRKERKNRETQMFNIEKSLAEFFEHDKGRLMAQNEELAADVKRLEGLVEEYRRKAAGISGKLGKDARADLTLNLLVENEQLQEKLFQQHAREKDDRDRQLKTELAALSYQRVLLSRLLEERNVKEAVVEILADDRKLQDLQSQTPKIETLKEDSEG